MMGCTPWRCCEASSSQPPHADSSGHHLPSPVPQTRLLRVPRQHPAVPIIREDHHVTERPRSLHLTDRFKFRRYRCPALPLTGSKCRGRKLKSELTRGPGSGSAPGRGRPRLSATCSSPSKSPTEAKALPLEKPDPPQGGARVHLAGTVSVVVGTDEVLTSVHPEGARVLVPGVPRDHTASP